MLCFNLKQTQVFIKSVFSITYLDVTLSAQVVDLRRLHLVDDLHQTGAVGQVSVVQLHVFKTATSYSFIINKDLDTKKI